MTFTKSTTLALFYFDRRFSDDNYFYSTMLAGSFRGWDGNYLFSDVNFLGRMAKQMVLSCLQLCCVTVLSEA